ncbi:unnamed protein product, partial [Linum tenue]
PTFSHNGLGKFVSLTLERSLCSLAHSALHASMRLSIYIAMPRLSTTYTRSKYIGGRFSLWLEFISIILVPIM